MAAVDADQTRRLHRYGLDVLLRLDAGQLAAFFDAFFELPVARWAPYLRVDASPAQVTLTMAALLRRAPLVGAAAPGGEPVRRALTDLRTASTQPAATAAEKMNHCTA